MNLTSVLFGDGICAAEVAGVASCQMELEEICGGELSAGEERLVVAVLVPEVDNPYSAEAIRVQIQRQTVGYLAPADAHAFRTCLKNEPLGAARYRCQALIRHAVSGGRKKQRGVYLDL